MSGVQRISLAVLIVVAVGFGGLWGLRSQPPGETEIIAASAARYVAETGGAPTDCAARPAALDGVRMVVSCGPGGAPAWVEALDARGNPVAVAFDADGSGT